MIFVCTLVQGVDHDCTTAGKDRERLMAADRLSANICGQNNNMKRGAEGRVIGNGSLYPHLVSFSWDAFPPNQRSYSMHTDLKFRHRPISMGV